MIFGQRLREAISEGRKSQHRIPVNGHTTDREYGICKVKPKRAYPIQTVQLITEGDDDRQRRMVVDHGLMLVTAVRRQVVDLITVDEAKAEGFARKGFGSREMFFEYWRAEHGGVECWVIEFEADLHAPRYLKAVGGYTLNIAQSIDPLPAVPADDQARFTSEAKFEDDLRAERRRKAWEAQGLPRRLELALDRAESEGLDVVRLQKRAEAAISALERELRRKAA